MIDINLPLYTEGDQDIRAIYNSLRVLERFLNAPFVKAKAGEVLDVGQPVYFYNAGGELYAKKAAAGVNNADGICNIAASTNAVTEVVAFKTVFYKYTGLSVGAYYYLSVTPGQISTTPSAQKLGVAIDQNSLLLYL